MKFTATIFVEGEADVKFLCDFVRKKFGYKLTGDEIQQTTGKDSLKQFQKNFQQSSGTGLTNLLIFDANGSIAERRNQLNAKKAELNIQFEDFLLPNNNDPGDLEVLLEQIINQQNAFIFNCFDTFNHCVVNVNHRLFPLNKKTKIHNYVSILVDDVSLAKEKNRDYLNNTHWNLDSNVLNPLFNFLQPYFVAQ